jgi:hypothetical protein
VDNKKISYEEKIKFLASFNDNIKDIRKYLDDFEAGINSKNFNQRVISTFHFSVFMINYAGVLNVIRNFFEDESKEDFIHEKINEFVEMIIDPDEEPLN